MKVKRIFQKFSVMLGSMILVALLFVGLLASFARPAVAATNGNSSSFWDVPTGYWAYSYIDILYKAGITKGCSTTPLAFCPEGHVSRAEMAVFLERGMNGASYQPPQGSGSVFSDVPSGYWALDWIEQLYDDKITSGCAQAPLRYCPENPITRAEMAVFLLRAKHGFEYVPIDTDQIGFNDVPSDFWAAAWIKQLAAEGITTGCGGGNYCPNNPVTRAQMAVFLVRTFIVDPQLGASIIVTSPADVIADDGLCTLREAVIAANTNEASGEKQGECPAGSDEKADTILLTANQVYSLNIDRAEDDTIADGDLDIADNTSALDLVIKGLGSGKATISQDALTVSDRVMENFGAVIKLENLVLTGGSNVGSGAGLMNFGSVTMDTCEVRSNEADWDGAGIWNGTTATLDIHDSLIASNLSHGFAGGIINKGTLVLQNSVITGNTDVYGGGGINNSGTLTVDHSTLSSNSSVQGGALYNSGTANILNGTLVGGPEPADANTAGSGGGGLFSLGTMTVYGATITGNDAPYGGGIFNWTGGMLTIDNTLVSNNSANEGGGLHNKEGATTVIQNGSIFSNNSAQWSAGGIGNWGSLTFTSSVLRENTSPGTGDAYSDGGPGGSMLNITGSCILDNGDVAVWTNFTTLINAIGNWWGAASGPTHATNPGGTGDSVGNYINFSGWLISPPAICP